MSVDWEEVLSELMDGTGISLDFSKGNFIIKYSNYFRDLGELLAKIEMEDISKCLLLIEFSIVSTDMVTLLACHSQPSQLAIYCL
jgi:hypothetical protein